MGKIDHRFVKINNLADIASEAKNDKIHYPFLPITEIRARAQMKNPVANKDDIALIIIYCDGICVGYLGLLPCLLKNGAKKNKVFAFSAFFVDAEYRKFKIAHKIMELAFSLNYDFFFSGYTDAFYKFSLKNPQWFTKIHDTHFLQINLDLMIPVFVKLEKKKRNVQSIFSRKPLIWISRFCLLIVRELSHNNFIKWLIKKNQIINFSGKKNIDIKRVEIVRPIKGFVSNLFESSHYFYRNADIINWMIQNPWITENPNFKCDYYFSAWRKQFKYLAYEFRCKKSDEYLGFSVFSISTRGKITTLTILDNEVVKEEYLILIVEQAIKVAADYSADKIIAPEYLFDTIRVSKKLKSLTIRKSKGNFLGPAKNSVYPSDYHQIILQYCEGDIPFS